eukprot:6944707-Pyramimonas_sp.AAC.1
MEIAASGGVAPNQHDNKPVGDRNGGVSEQDTIERRCIIDADTLSVDVCWGGGGRWELQDPE